MERPPQCEVSALCHTCALQGLRCALLAPGLLALSAESHHRSGPAGCPAEGTTAPELESRSSLGRVSKVYYCPCQVKAKRFRCCLGMEMEENAFTK